MNDLIHNFPMVALPLKISALFVILFFFYKLIQILRPPQNKEVPLFVLWLLGLLTSLFGVLFQILSLRKAFDQIEAAGEISSGVVSSAIRDSYIHTIFGLLVLIVSLVLWGILKLLKEK